MASTLGLLLEIKSNKFNYKFESTFNMDIQQFFSKNILGLKPYTSPSELLLSNNNNSILLSKWQTNIPESIINSNSTNFSLDNHSHFIYSPYFININPMLSKIMIGASIILLLSILVNGIIPLISYIFSICIKYLIPYIKSSPVRPSKRARTQEEKYKYNKKEHFTLTSEDPKTTSDTIHLGSFGRDDGDDEDEWNRKRKNLIPGDKFIFNEITYLEIQTLINHLKELVKDLQSTRILENGTIDLNWNYPDYVVNRADYWYNVFIRIFNPIISEFSESEREQHKPVIRTFARIRDTYYDYLLNIFGNISILLEGVPAENLRFLEDNPPTSPGVLEINAPDKYPSIFESFRPLGPCHLIYDINGKTLERGTEVHSKMASFYNAEFWEDWVNNMIRLLTALQLEQINENNTPQFRPHFSTEDIEWKKKYKPQYPKPPPPPPPAL